MLARVARRLRHLLRRRAAEREMDEEMRLHLELEIADRVRRGMTPAEAERTTLVAFGGVERFKEDARDARGVRFLDDLWQDAQYALRVLGKSRGFTVAAVATLAIGIAATTGVFSLMNAVLFRPLPVPEPRRLFVVAEVWKDGQRSVSTDMAQHKYGYAHYLALRAASAPVFTGLAGFRYGTVTLRAADEARVLSSIATSANYFQVLGLRPALGQLYSDTTERFGAAIPEVVLGYDLWQREFAGDPGVVGRTLVVDSRPMTVMGVAPAGFGGTMPGIAADVWIAAATAVRAPFEPRPIEDLRHRAGMVTMFGRLRSDISEERALALLAVIGPSVEPDEPWQRVARLTLDPMIGVPAMARGVTLGFTGMLFLTASFVLMIAAANIAGMLLARAAHRRREIAIRLALGASRGRLVRQLVTESLVLCLAGGVAGVILARWLVSLLPVVQPPIGIRVSLDLEMDPLVLAVSFGVALVAGLVAGVTPALQSTRFDLLSGLRGLGAGGGDMRGRSRRVFVVGQLAMSLVLLVVAGLFTRAAQRALRTDPGLDARRVAVGLVDTGSHGYDRDRGEAFYRRLVERLAARPEITAVALGQWTPLSLGHMGDGIALPDGSRIGVTYGVADRGYLEAMRIPVVAGRSFDARDTRTSAPAVIVNETLARRLWPGQSPIGQAIKFAGAVREVIGVVRDGKYRSLDEPPTAFAFIPFAQRYSGQMTVHVRARADAAAALAALRAEVRALDPNVAVDRARLLADDIALYSLIQRVAAWVVGVFGLVGMVLAALGTYAVVAYRVAQRTREIGIRMALGARSSDVVLRVLREGLAMIATGVAIGIPVALIAARAVRSFLFGLDTADAITFAAVPALLGVIAAIATYLPARRAAAVDPMISLRTD